MIDNEKMSPSTWVQLEGIGNAKLVDETRSEVVNILTMAFDPQNVQIIDDSLLEQVLTREDISEETGKDIISKGHIKTDFFGNLEYIFTSDNKLKKYTSNLPGGKEVLSVFKKDDKVIILFRTFN